MFLVAKTADYLVNFENDYVPNYRLAGMVGKNLLLIYILNVNVYCGYLHICVIMNLQLLIQLHYR